MIAAAPTSSVSVRLISAADAESCGIAGFEAHTAVAHSHNVPPEQHSIEFATGLVRAKIADPNATGFVAERKGEVVGSVFLTSFPPGRIGAIGPLTVRPSAEGGVGRKLLEAAMAEARRVGLIDVRLVQSPSHLRSLALYTTMGFIAREPLVLVKRIGRMPPVAASGVRPATETDVATCNRLSQDVLGFQRAQQLQSAVAGGTALVVEHDGRVSGYAARLGLAGHGVGRETQDLQALIAHSAEIYGPGFFVPIRNSVLLRWVLEQGFRMLWPALLMTSGSYREPRGAYLPAISF